MSETNIKSMDINPAIHEKYEHIFDTFSALWNEALNHIAEHEGPTGLEAYNARAMDRSVMSRSVFNGVDKILNCAEMLRNYLSHHVMMNSELEIIKVDHDEIIVDVRKCGSKSRLVRKFGGNQVRHYCSHCLNLRFYEQVGWKGSIDFSAAAREDGENIGCRRILRAISRQD